MVKKIFIGFMLFAAVGRVHAATSPGAVSANPNAGSRPSVATSSAASRFSAVPALNGVVGGIVPTPAAVYNANQTIGEAIGKKCAGLTQAQITTATNCIECENPLPDQITTSRCVQKYMACLKQDSVCGANFESCDTKKRLKQKRILCQEKLLECPDDGISAIYGTTVTSETRTASCEGELKTIARTFSIASCLAGNATTPTACTSLADIDFEYSSSSSDQSNQIAQAIYDGAKYLADNSLAACISIADGCVKRACQNNAFKCLVGGSKTDASALISELDAIDLTTGGTGTDGAMTAADLKAKVDALIKEKVGDGLAGGTATRVPAGMLATYVDNMAFSADAANKYIKDSCKADVGTSKACYLIANSKAPKDDSWTVDDFEIEMVYNAAMILPLKNWSKITEWLAQGVADTVDSCKTAVRNCVTNSCGSGSLAACYGMAAQGGALDLTKFNTAVGTTCQALVSANQNCRDLLAKKGETVTAAEMWKKVWGEVKSGAFDDSDSFGLAGQLFTELGNMFNETVERNLFTQCRNEAESCVRRECGTNFASCYINDKLLSKKDDVSNDNYGAVQMDGYGDAIGMENAAGGFDSTMAKSLCLLPIKRSDSCQNYFDITYAKNLAAGGSFTSSGSWSNMSNGLAGAGSGWSSTVWGTGDAANKATVKMCSANKNYYEEYEKIKNDDGTYSSNNKDVYTGTAAADASRCGAQEESIFGELIADISQTARAQLTKEQNLLKNACEKHKGASSMGDTYVWAAKPGNEDTSGPANLGQNGTGTDARSWQETYPILGIGGAQPATADLWGAFCQVKVTLSSNEKMLKGMFESGSLKYKVASEENKNYVIWTENKTSYSETTHTMASKVNAYFSLGDVITCGSWLKQADLDMIETAIIAEEASKIEDGRNFFSKNAGTIGMVAGIVGGGVGGWFAGGALGEKLAKNSNKDKIGTEKAAEEMEKLKAVKSKFDTIKNNVAINAGDSNTDAGAGALREAREAKNTVERIVAAASNAIAGLTSAAVGDEPKEKAVEAAKEAVNEASEYIGLANNGTAKNIIDKVEKALGKIRGIFMSEAKKVQDPFSAVGLSSDDFSAASAAIGIAEAAIEGAKKFDSNVRFKRKNAEGSSNEVRYDGLAGVYSETIQLYDYGVLEGGSMSYREVNAELDAIGDKISAAEKAINSQTDVAQDKKVAESKLWGNAIGALGGAALLGVAGTQLANGIEENRLKLEKLKAGDEAVKKWFDNVGSKIQCVIGGKIVGSYGDMIELK